MPRTPKYQPTVDECLTIKISLLNEWGHLKPDLDVYLRQYIWSKNGRQIASIGYSIESPEGRDHKWMTLDYQVRRKPVKYKVKLVSIPSNLGIGVRWYFLCPETGERCMNLICPPGEKYFLHRNAYDLLYESQKKSKEYRRIEAAFGWMFEEEKLYEE